MLNSFRFFLGLAFVLLCGPAFAGAPSDADLSAKIAGRWQEVRDLGCEVHRQVMEMWADGTFQVKGTIRTCEGTRQFVWRGTWVVKQGKLYYTTTYSSPEGEYPLGEQWNDQIISVSATEWVMLEQSTGNASYAFKIK